MHAGSSTVARVLRARRRRGESRRHAGSTAAMVTLDAMAGVAHQRLDVKLGHAPLCMMNERPTSRRPVLTSSRMSSAMSLASLKSTADRAPGAAAVGSAGTRRRATWNNQ